jgi:hypothetical protein
MALDDEFLARIATAVEESLRWQRAAVLPEVRQTIERALITSQLRQAYELCDGSHTGAEIANAVGASPASISGWSRKWRDLGIAHETKDRKIQHLVSLDALGMTIKLDDDGAKKARVNNRSKSPQVDA